jgi:hypothetical protein
MQALRNNMRVFQIERKIEIVQENKSIQEYATYLSNCGQTMTTSHR